MKSDDIRNLVPAYIQAFDAYYPSQPDTELMRLYRVNHLHRLNNNENPLGPPPEVRQVFSEFSLQRIPVYPNGDCHDLRQSLSEVFHKDSDRFLVGNGSCEVIASVIKAFCEKGDNIITADRTFAVYEWVAAFSGFEPRLIPLTPDYGFDPQAMLDAMDERTKILFVCNPNNPTGTFWSRDTMTHFLDQVNGRAIVVIDEAYCEYVTDPDFPDGMALMEQYPNVVVFRTFSKMYALAALRIGYLCGVSDVVDIIRKTHIVYSVNTLAQMSATAALSNDGSFIHQTREMVAAAARMLCPVFESLGLEYVRHEGNFIMVRVPMADTLLYRHLMARGVMVRTMTGFRFPGWIRVTLAPEPVMADFCTAFTSVLADTRS